MRMIEFWWDVPQAGFRWIKTRGYPRRLKSGYSLRHSVHGQYLIQNVMPGQAATYRKYPLSAKTGLFITLADTESSMDGIVGFANQYGFLGGKCSIPVNVPIDEGLNMYARMEGELFETWVTEIAALQSAVALGKSLHLFDTTKPRCGTDDPKWDELQKIVTAKLKEKRCDPCLLWDGARSQRRLKVRFRPTSLIAAVWVQLALAIEGDLNYRQCEQCMRWFEIAAEKREDAKFCSNACRFRAYRGRQKEARDLHARGMSIKQIAAEIGSDIGTVSGWVEEK